MCVGILIFKDVISTHTHARAHTHYTPTLDLYMVLVQALVVPTCYIVHMNECSKPSTSPPTHCTHMCRIIVPDHPCIVCSTCHFNNKAFRNFEAMIFTTLNHHFFCVMNRISKQSQTWVEEAWLF